MHVSVHCMKIGIQMLRLNGQFREYLHVRRSQYMQTWRACIAKSCITDGSRVTDRCLFQLVLPTSAFVYITRDLRPRQQLAQASENPPKNISLVIYMALLYDGHVFACQKDQSLYSYQRESYHCSAGRLHHGMVLYRLRIPMRNPHFSTRIGMIGYISVAAPDTHSRRG